VHLVQGASIVFFDKNSPSNPFNGIDHSEANAVPNLISHKFTTLKVNGQGFDSSWRNAFSRDVLKIQAVLGDV
jgi:hypothetical protein